MLDVCFAVRIETKDHLKELSQLQSYHASDKMIFQPPFSFVCTSRSTTTVMIIWRSRIRVKRNIENLLIRACCVFVITGSYEFTYTW